MNIATGIIKFKNSEGGSTMYEFAVPAEMADYVAHYLIDWESHTLMSPKVYKQFLAETNQSLITHAAKTQVES